MNPSSTESSFVVNSPFARAAEAFLGRLAETGPLQAEAVLDEFPEHAAELRRLLPTLLTLVAFGQTEDANTPSPYVGRSLGDFQLLRELGRGGMGIVYEAEQISLGRRVAVKILPLAAILEERQLLRFRHEATASAMLKHPNIVSIYSVGSERGVYYYAMELIEGFTLAELIAARRESNTASDETPLQPRSTSAAATETMRSLFDPTMRRKELYTAMARLGIQAAEALEHAHEHGILHRDVKPSNLMVNAIGHLWVTDFGLAHIEASPQLTLDGELLGTLRYMSPEQAAGKAAAVNHRSDIYSLGATLYEVATERTVVNGDDRSAILREIADAAPAPPRSIVPSIPADFETILLKCLAKEPAARYESAQALADDLRRFVEQKPIVARRVTWFVQTYAWVRRHRALAALTAIACCATLLLVATLAWHNYHLRIAYEFVAAAQAETERHQYELVTGLADIARRAGNLAFVDSLLKSLVPRAGEVDHRDFAWHWINRAAHDTELVLPGHQGAATAVAYSPTGRTLASGGADGAILIWDSVHGELQHTLTRQAGTINALTYSPDGTTLASAADAGQIRIWKASDGTKLGKLKAGDQDVLCIAFSPDNLLIAAGGADGCVRIWDAQTRELVHQIPDANPADPDDWIRCLQFSPDGKLLATGGHDQVLRIYRVANWELAGRGTAQEKLLAVDFLPANDQLVTGSSDGRVRRWDVATVTPSKTISKGNAWIRSVLVAANGKEVHSLDFRGKLRTDSLEKEDHEPRELMTSAMDAWCADLAPDDRRVATTGSDGVVRVWNLERPAGGRVDHRARALSMFHRLSTDGSTLVFSYRSSVEIWDARSRDTLDTFKSPYAPIVAVAISCDGKLVAFGDSTNHVEIWNTQTRTQLQSWQLSNSVNDLDFVAGGDLLCTSSMKGARLWRISDGVPIAYFPGDAIHGSRVSPDGNWLAIGDYTNDCLTMVDIKQRQVRYSLPKSLKRGVAFSSDGARFAADHPDGTIYLYDASNGRVLNRLIGSPSNKLNSIAFSPDDRLLALADEDGVRLVSCRSGRELARIEDHTRTTEVTFTPDGRSLWGVCNRAPHFLLVRWSPDLESADRVSP